VSAALVACLECEGGTARSSCSRCGGAGAVPACAVCEKHAQEPGLAPCCSRECREVWEARNPDLTSGKAT